MAAVLRLSEGRVRHGPLEVLHGVDFVVPDHGVVAVLGRNGAGKTSLLRALAGTLPLAGGRLVAALPGTIESGGGRRAFDRLPPGRRARAGITLVPDHDAVFGGLRVVENLRLFAGGHTSVDPALTAFPPLREHLTRRVDTLSGGEQQMVALSRVFLSPWRVLLVDELSRGLAAPLAGRLYRTLAELAHGAAPDGTCRTVVFAEPYPRDVYDIADLCYVLRRGELVFAGEPTESRAEQLADLIAG